MIPDTSLLQIAITAEKGRLNRILPLTLYVVLLTLCFLNWRKCMGIEPTTGISTRHWI